MNPEKRSEADIVLLSPNSRESLLLFKKNKAKSFSCTTIPLITKKERSEKDKEKEEKKEKKQ